MLVVIVDAILPCINVVEEERQEDEVMVEVLEEVLVHLVQVKGRSWRLHVVL